MQYTPQSSSGRPDETTSIVSGTRYARLRRKAVLLTAIVALAPLFILTVVNYFQYYRALRSEMVYPLTQVLSNAKRSLEFVIAERVSALRLIVLERSIDQLNDEVIFQTTFSNIKTAFGGYIDLGLIESNGIQTKYIGPYELKGVNFSDQDWFQEASLRGVYVSDVFLGRRASPHFIIAVKRELVNGDFYILRATLDMELLNQQIRAIDPNRTGEAFIINREGVMQTESRRFGRILETCLLSPPPYSHEAMVEDNDESPDGKFIRGFAYIEQSPFILMVAKPRNELTQNWKAVRNELILFLITSLFLILGVIVWSANNMVNRIREADERRARAYHQMEYDNKMATIGRLAAGVAHEINNPLAIINEKAGLIHDIAESRIDPPTRDKIISTTESILKSVERCSAVTHRLLGFARRMEARSEKIDLKTLLEEVLGFVGKETIIRNIVVGMDFQPDLPAVLSDRGQLQQVFLNILNNAIAAVRDGGQINISGYTGDNNEVIVAIGDNGDGIPPESLKYIFEPFFSTKGELGTGLGLSITYDIVRKLGGKITVESEVGKGTTFRITLPQ